MEDTDEAERRPIHTEDEAAEEASWMAREGTLMAVVSIGLMLLLVLGLWAVTDVGFDTPPWPYVVAFVVVLLGMAGAVVWGRRDP